MDNDSYRQLRIPKYYHHDSSSLFLIIELTGWDSDFLLFSYYDMSETVRAVWAAEFGGLCGVLVTLPRSIYVQNNDHKRTTATPTEVPREQVTKRPAVCTWE